MSDMSKMSPLTNIQIKALTTKIGLVYDNISYIHYKHATNEFVVTYKNSKELFFNANRYFDDEELQLFLNKLI